MTLYALRFRGQHPEMSAPLTRNASVTVRDGHATIRPESAAQGALAGWHPAPNAARSSMLDAVPKSDADSLVRIGAQVVNGKHISIFASKNSSKEKPAKALLTTIDGQLASVDELKWKKLNGQWVVVSGSTTRYDQAGRPRAAFTFSYRDDDGSVVGKTDTKATSVRLAVADVVHDLAEMFLPRLAHAQYGPCDLLRQVAFDTAAVAAWKWNTFYELEELCEVSIVERPEAAVLVCADADLAYLQAFNADTDALLAKADWYQCVAEQAALAALAGGIPTDRWVCYDTYGWIYDPSIDEEIYTALRQCDHISEE